MQRFKPVFMLFSVHITALVGNDDEGVWSVKDDLRADDLRIFLYGGVGGMAIHVGVGGGDAMDVVAIVSAGVTEEEVDSLWICEDNFAVGVPMGEAVIEGKTHISTLFDWASSKSGLRNMDMASSSVV